MSTNDARFAGSIPTIYEQYLVPIMFQHYAEDIAERLNDLRQGVLIELAAGTGALTRALRSMLPASVSIVATDLNEAMLRVGQSRLSDPSVTWQQADAQKLPFADGSAAALVCQFGLMFLPDKVAGYREARRVLSGNGRYVFNVWDRLEHNEISLLAIKAVAALFPDNPPLFFERTPFGYADVAVIRRQLEQAGFTRIDIETVHKVARVPSAEHAAIALCQGTPLRGEIEDRDPARLDEATNAAMHALRARFGEGPFDHRMSAHVVTARSA